MGVKVARTLGKVTCHHGIFGTERKAKASQNCTLAFRKKMILMAQITNKSHSRAGTVERENSPRGMELLESSGGVELCTTGCGVLCLPMQPRQATLRMPLRKCPHATSGTRAMGQALLYRLLNNVHSIPKQLNNFFNFLKPPAPNCLGKCSVPRSQEIQNNQSSSC